MDRSRTVKRSIRGAGSSAAVLSRPESENPAIRHEKEARKEMMMVIWRRINRFALAVPPPRKIQRIWAISIVGSARRATFI